MIEITKYNVSTFDPHSSAINQRSDFTRRIPTGLSPKQMARDAKIIAQIIRADETEDYQKVLEIYINKAHLLSNPRYWEVMRTVWVAAGTTANAEKFRRMMRMPRPCKGWFMTPEDKDALDKMTFPLTVWRAYNADLYPDDTDPGLSWTLDKAWCEEYAAIRGLVIKERQVERQEVFAYISRRGEQEIIIL